MKKFWYILALPSKHDQQINAFICFLSSNIPCFVQDPKAILTIQLSHKGRGEHKIVDKLISEQNLSMVEQPGANIESETPIMGSNSASNRTMKGSDIHKATVSVLKRDSRVLLLLPKSQSEIYYMIDSCQFSSVLFLNFAPGLKFSLTAVLNFFSYHNFLIPRFVCTL